MNNANVRDLVARIFGDTLSSYTQKMSSLLLYRFETTASEETLALLAAIETHNSVYPDQITYFQIYGSDGYENTGAIIVIGTKCVPTASPLFFSALNMTISAI